MDDKNDTISEVIMNILKPQVKDISWTLFQIISFYKAYFITISITHKRDKPTLNFSSFEYIFWLRTFDHLDKRLILI